ncbi:50S ribosomal protein L22 [Metamycoplasma arthritidis]|uniref:Large ribosomal subunit protein uL22 n=1 Tax=Metamycoplasma arthritidis (strain 158L3-1) TaxID=243272 RepID=RL22_META1|nr:RecName: Full=Large ribosomal subunit protein uL22; AltName: Full=50S ribosomal protein L22 [Metamycoplasma arthritidis 158L3-1]ACF07294.1 ribosomal protein L22 [Metamycoplasma arthritidis 158L3-1]VEU78816.1 50S ribosomal protein L22 [Metamycoplasma arthritidis]
MVQDIFSKSAVASVKAQRISPRKARLVADLIRYKTATQALIILQTTNKKASGIILKLLNSAIANATNNNGLDATKLVVTEILVNDGPTLKRYQPHSRGRAYPILKRTSHFFIRVSEVSLPSVNEMTSKETVKEPAKKPSAKVEKPAEAKAPKQETSTKKPTTTTESKPKTSKAPAQKQAAKVAKPAAEDTKKPVKKSTTTTKSTKKEGSK